MEPIKADLESRIASKKVFVVSKRTCPYSTMAKDCLKKYVGNGKPISKDEYEVMEIDDGEYIRTSKLIQTYMGKKTGARTVPRVFINGQCIGGGDDVKYLDNSGKLEAMLRQ